MYEKESSDLTPSANEIVRLSKNDIHVNRSFPVTGFVADQSLMDELRAQYSCLSPKLERYVSDIAAETVGSLMDRYDAIIPSSVKEASAGIINRFLCVSREDYATLDPLWGNPHATDLPQADENVRGVFHKKQGRLVIFQEPPLWLLKGPLSAEEEAAIEKNGGMKAVEGAVLISYMVNVIAHESIHEYGSVLPSALSEAGADYYTSEISQDFEAAHITKYGEKPKAFYRKLVEKYGEDIHKIYFGSPVDPKIRANIYAELTPEIVEELFPGDLLS